MLCIQTVIDLCISCVRTTFNKDDDDDDEVAGYFVRVGVQYMGSLLYADDIASLAGSCDGLQKIMHTVWSYLGHYLLLIQLKASYLLLAPVAEYLISCHCDVAYNLYFL